MNLRDGGDPLEFTLPIRVRWDVDFRGRVKAVRRIARGIREIGPLVVELRASSGAGLSALPAVFAELGGDGTRIQATVGLTPEAVAAVRWGYPAEFVWDVGAGGPFAARLPAEGGPVSFTPDETTIGALPDVLEEFAESPAGTLHLPNVNAVRASAEKGHVPVPRPGQVAMAAAEAARLSVPLRGKRIHVHDFFLWKSLRQAYPEAAGERVEFAGCQAAQALAYVDWDGNVYPCDALPIRLGNIVETPFAAVWDSPARARLLAALRAVPGACDGCGHYDGCHGGCRGLAWLGAGSLDDADPSCPGNTGGAGTAGKGSLTG